METHGKARKELTSRRHLQVIWFIKDNLERNIVMKKKLMQPIISCEKKRKGTISDYFIYR
jgi:hypothetical protein